MLLKLLVKVLFWIVLTLIFFIIYNILMVTQCTKPKSGVGTCFLRHDTGRNNTFEFDLSKLKSTGGECTDALSYESPGQTADWIDTGFTTNGKQLIVYANGEYYPWGEQYTPNVMGYHIINNNNGSFLEMTYGPAECKFNTDVVYQLDDSQETKAIYNNQFNQYTGWNANNRSKNNNGKKIYEAGQQADCITGVNCEMGDEEEQMGCVLKNGAGIYMRIGNDTTFAYHIKNYFVPNFKEECSTSGNCKLQYKTSNNGQTFELVQVPFALPPVLYKYNYTENKKIFDIRDDVKKNLSIISEADSKTEYKFSTIVADVENELCDGKDHQRINGLCYKQVVQPMTMEQLRTPHCPESSQTTINLANELCAPQSNKRIWIKPADTCYDDNSGKIRLTFESGVYEHTTDVDYNNDGIKISWITSIVKFLFTPFFGSQYDEDEPDKVIKRMTNDNSSGSEKKVMFCRNDGKEIFFTRKKNDWFIKTEKYGTTGLLVYDIKAKDDFDSENKTTNTMTASYKMNGAIRDCVLFEFKPGINKTRGDIDFRKFSTSNTALVRVADMQSGLFIQIRNGIMSTSLYNVARIMLVVWFIMSFGIAFVNRNKVLSKVVLVSSDWKRFLILLFCTDKDNYDFIDELLWPALFYGSQSIAEGIFEAISGVYGTSLQADSAMEFFDQVISSILSKQTFYKLGAIATSDLTFIMFFVIFPLLVSCCFDFLIAVMGPIVSLGFTLFNVGSIIMFMPVYALLSLFGNAGQKNTFTKTVKMLINEFIHFAFELGFFGLMIGFIYHYFLQAIDLKVCWREKLTFMLFIIPINLKDWQICNDGSDLPAGVGERFVILWNMLWNVFIFQLINMIFGKFSVLIADKMANIFAKGGSMVGIKQANRLSDGVQALGKKGITDLDNYFEAEKKDKQHAREMDEKKKLKENQAMRNRRLEAIRQHQRQRRLDALNKFGGDLNTGIKPNNNNNNTTYNRVKTAGDTISRTNEANNNKTTGKPLADGANLGGDNQLQKLGHHLSTLQKNVIGGDSKTKKTIEKKNIEHIHHKKDENTTNKETENRGAMIQNNDLTIKENKPGMQENDYTLKENENPGIKNAIEGENSNKQNEQQQEKQKLQQESKEIQKQTQKTKRKEKTIKEKLIDIHKQINELNALQLQSTGSKAMRIMSKKNELIKIAKELERIQDRSSQKLKMLKKNAYEITKQFKNPKK